MSTLGIAGFDTRISHSGCSKRLQPVVECIVATVFIKLLFSANQTVKNCTGPTSIVDELRRYVERPFMAALSRTASPPSLN